jgi:ABC-type amino acid transport substrate-binding protein
MKQLSIFIFSIVSVVQGYSQLQGDSWKKIEGTGKGTLSVVYYEQPGLIQKVNGEMKGVCIDILSDFKAFVKEKHNKDIDIKYVSNQKEFASFLAVVQNTPNVLGVTNTSITNERKKVLKFSPPYMATPVVLLTHENVPTVKALDQLTKTFAGFSAEVIAGSTHVKTMEEIRKKHLPSLVIKQVGSSDVVLKDLSVNQKLFSVLDFTEYVSVVRRKLPVKRHEVDLGGAQELGFIMSKQSDWDVLWNEFLTPEYRKSVGYKKIISENLGATFLNLVR